MQGDWTVSFYGDFKALGDFNQYPKSIRLMNVIFIYIIQSHSSVISSISQKRLCIQIEQVWSQSLVPLLSLSSLCTAITGGWNKCEV